MEPIRHIEGAESSDDFLNQLVNDYGRALVNYFMKRGAQHATAEDLTQEVYSRLLKRKNKDPILNIRGYIMQTAWSVWSDYWRRQKSRVDNYSTQYDDMLHSPEGNTPELALEGKEAIFEAVKILRQMPDRTRQIYLLCHVDGMKRKHMARRLGISVSAIDKHLISAKKQLGRLRDSIL